MALPELLLAGEMAKPLEPLRCSGSFLVSFARSVEMPGSSGISRVNGHVHHNMEDSFTGNM